jgi:hypothetical protein
VNHLSTPYKAEDNLYGDGMIYVWSNGENGAGHVVCTISTEAQAAEANAAFIVAACNMHDGLVATLADWITVAGRAGAPVASDVLAWADSIQAGRLTTANQRTRGLIAALAAIPEGGTP